MAAPRIGVFGGTFDPIHVGHLVAAVNARHALDLDTVLLVVANEPWQKVGRRPISAAADRFSVAAAAVAGLEGIEASSLEIDRGGPSYTADTLATLAERHPGADLVVVVGADVATEIDTWERAGEIRERARLAVVNRPGASIGRLPHGWRADEVEIPALDVSSTDLRSRAAEGRPLDFLIPAGAIRVIAERGLYAGGR